MAETTSRAKPTFSVQHAAGAIIFLRIASSFAWLDSAFIGKDAKFAPAFLSGAGLAQRVAHGFVHTALAAWISDALQIIVLPHAALFAWLIALGNLAAWGSLLFGLLTRLGALIEIALAITNILVSGGAGADTIGFNSMLIVAGVLCILCRAGRNYGLDRHILARWPSSRLTRLLA